MIILLKVTIKADTCIKAAMYYIQPAASGFIDLQTGVKSYVHASI
jgi:hypothetical protein